MKNLKKTMLLFAFFGLGTLTSFAQERLAKKQPSTELKQKIEDLKKQMNLTEDQAAKFKEINKSFALKIKEVRQPAAERQEKRDKILALRKAKDVEMKAILSETQYKIYVDFAEKRKNEMNEKRNKS